MGLGSLLAAGACGIIVVLCGRVLALQDVCKELTTTLDRTAVALVAARIAERDLDVVIGRLQDLVIVARADGTIRWVSPSVFALGWERRALLGHASDILVAREQRAGFGQLWCPDGTRLRVRLQALRLPSGGRAWVGTPVTSPWGTV